MKSKQPGKELECREARQLAVAAPSGGLDALVELLAA